MSSLAYWMRKAKTKKDIKIRVSVCDNEKHIHNGREVIQVSGVVHKTPNPDPHWACLHCKKYADQLQEIYIFNQRNEKA